MNMARTSNHEKFSCMKHNESENKSVFSEEGLERKRPLMDNSHARRLFRLYRKTNDPAIKEELFRNYLGLACFYARKYSGRGVDYEDLCQEASLGLLKAIEGFDPARGVEFHTYAIWFVEGWIRQYFRDKAWICKVPRSVKGMSLKIKHLSRELGRFPTREEVAERCKIPDERIDDAIVAAQTWSSVSLYEGQAVWGLKQLQVNDDSCVDGEMDAVLTRLFIEDAAKKSLDVSESAIVRMYYFDDLSQRDIATKIGTYPMMISRSLQKSAEKLGVALTEEGRKAC